MAAPGSILGTRVVRTEDPELVTGRGRYVADLPLEGKVFAVFVRSDVAHGIVNEVHVEDAVGMPGVVAVWRAADLGVAPHHGSFKVHDDFARPPLATDRVRFAGDIVAVVFAETQAQGEDAAAMVWADVDPLPAVVDPEAALAPGLDPIFPEHGDNVAMALIDKAVVDLEATSDLVVRGRYVNQRMAVAPMEVNCCAAVPAPDGRVTVHPSTQMPHGLHDSLAQVLGWDKSEIHVVTPRVGGGFGGKAGICPEYTVVVKAARDLGRPVV
jgi:carbon-monoxide dehydrogenase large subunit